MDQDVAISIRSDCFITELSSQQSYEYMHIMKKTLRETQTLQAGCSKAEPKIVASPQTPSRGVGQHYLQL